jgi:hypothetical protein
VDPLSIVRQDTNEELLLAAGTLSDGSSVPSGRSPTAAPASSTATKPTSSTSPSPAS